MVITFGPSVTITPTTIATFVRSKTPQDDDGDNNDGDDDDDLDEDDDG